MMQVSNSKVLSNFNFEIYIEPEEAGACFFHVRKKMLFEIKLPHKVTFQMCMIIVLLWGCIRRLYIDGDTTKIRLYETFGNIARISN